MTTQCCLLLQTFVASLCAVLISTAINIRDPLDEQARAVAALIVEFVPATHEGAGAAYPRANRSAPGACATDDLSDLWLLPAGWRRCSYKRAVQDRYSRTHAHHGL